MTDLVLYHADLSPCAHKVRLALEERGVPFESRQINLMAKENLGPEYLAINPKGLVPALLHGENVVTESTVILEYLEECFPGHPLMPASAMGKVKVRHWFKWVDEHLHPNTMPIVFGGLARFVWLAKPEEERRTLLEQVPDASRRARQERLIEHGFDAPDVEPALAVWRQTFEKLEQQTGSSRWLAGEEFTLADCVVAPYVFIMKYLQVDGVFERYPGLHDWFGRVTARPSWDRAVVPYVDEQRWTTIAAAAGKSGPQLDARLFG